MKKLLFILALVCGVSSPIWAQTTADANHKITINAKGGIYDHGGGTALGYIGKDDIVRNAQGQKLYFIDKDGNVIDAKGNKLGKAKKNGNYYNINGENIMNTKDIDAERCAILDPQGHNFGTTHKNYKLHACAAHCYFLEQQKAKEKKDGVKQEMKTE